MSLQVWLPLTKDLRNQGLSSATIINNGASTSTAGKLGGCYSFNGSSNYLYTTEQEYFGNNYSFAAWVYTTSTSATQTIGCIRTAVGSGFSLFLIGGKLRIDPGGNNVQWTTSYTYPANTWFHLVVTYDGTTVKYYINGEYKQSYTTTISSTYWGNTLSFGVSQANGSSYGNYLNGRLNDIRVYNHCLSPMEVKELAKGLVLHYPLNRQGWGQENIIVTNSMAPTSGTAGWACAGTGWSNSNVTSVGASNGHAIRCTFSGTTGVSGGPYHSLGVDKSTLANGVYTVSARLRASKSCIATFYNELMTTSSSITLTTDWKIYTFTGTIDNSKTYSACVIYVRAADATQNMWVECDWVKLETGAIATPWCPNSSDALATTMGLNSTTEYDCSGFCNNGTRTGTFTWTSDTPKYAVSTQFSSGSKIASTTGMITTANPTFTCSFWVNMPTGTYTTWADLVTFKGSAQFRMETSNTTGTNLSWYNYPIGTSSGIGTNGSVSNNQWNHFAITCDGTNWKTYKNGVLASTVALSGTTWTPDRTISLGDNGMLMKMSDFRIYATALSASDVKSLYQNCATIDPDGTIRGQIRS